MEQTTTLAGEFERESHRIDQLIWDAMALRAGESALFCGVANSIDWIKRAVAIGVDVSVIANQNTAVSDFGGGPVKLIRGSTSMLPARDASFDATIAFHYLHEVDPFFHADVVSELGRVGKRTVIVEPAPPSDPLGLRIASLYSRAKRELGQFENYHHIDYWRKLLTLAKSNVSYQTFTFMRTLPRWAIRDTVALIIDTMAAEETPEAYLAELRALARRPDAQLLPQARFVIVGSAVGAHVNASAGTNYRAAMSHEPAGAASRTPAEPRERTPAPTAAPALRSRVYSAAETGAEFPAVEPPAPAPRAGASQIARNAFGLPAGDGTPVRPAPAPSVKGEDGGSFGLPESAENDPAAEFGWEWETPSRP